MIREMTRRIKRIAPLQAGKMMGVLYGCIFGVISAAIYNLIARWIGGIEVEVE